jgi:predicted phage tail protein
MKPGETRNCVRCQGVAIDITPLKEHDVEQAIFACQTCGQTFRHDGTAFVAHAGALRDIFRGATLAGQTLDDALGGQQLNAATRALLTARLVEYGLSMWMDGVKQGILLGTIQKEKGE